jgi:ATP-binding cassette, subfamily G (WHITE), member 2, PDR
VAALLILFASIYILSAEFVRMLPPRSDILVFQKRHLFAPRSEDEETGQSSASSEEKIPTRDSRRDSDLLGVSDGAHLVWTGLTYDINLGKKKTKRILDNIEGWVKPRTLTALMVRLLPWVSCSWHLLTTSGRLWSGKNHSAQCSGRANLHGNCQRR